MIGIVASRLVDYYQRPTVIVAFGDEFAQGSARSVTGFNLYEAIRDCSEGLIGFGGHAAAAGLKLTESHFPIFAQRFEERCRSSLTAEHLQKVLVIDAEVPLGVLLLTSGQRDRAARASRHGQSPPALAGQPGPDHGRAATSSASSRTISSFAWFKAILRSRQLAGTWPRRPRNSPANTSCSIVFHPSINEWNGRRDVQLELKDLVIENDRPAPLAAEIR